MYRVPFLEPCSGCGGYTEIDTNHDYLVMGVHLASIGDRVMCSRCQCTGVIDIDENGKFCHWAEDLCNSCNESFERELDLLSVDMARRIRQMLLS